MGWPALIEPCAPAPGCSRREGRGRAPPRAAGGRTAAPPPVRPRPPRPPPPPRPAGGWGRRGVRSGALRGFALPSLPVRLDPGQGTVSLSLALVGDSVHARWSMQSERVHWMRDSATARSQLGDIVWRVVSGVSTVDVSASLDGVLARPRLVVGSNLDRVLAERIRAVAGEAIAGAERQGGAPVDSGARRRGGARGRPGGAAPPRGAPR